jgi:hypothetical protein
MYPLPGGVLSLLLIFPVIALGARLAGAHPLEKTRKRRIITGVVLGFLLLLAALDLLLALVPLLVFFFYGMLSSIEIVRNGQGRRRFVVSTIVTVWTVFCLTDYVASIQVDSNRMAANEAAAVGRLRTLRQAEQVFLQQTHTNSSENLRFGSIEELRNKKLLGDDLAPEKLHSGYLFHEAAGADAQHYVFYAVPAQLAQDAHKPAWVSFAPGASILLKSLWRDDMEGTGQRSFAIDETGTLRYSVSPTTPPVLRAQAEQWPLL